MAAGYPSPAVYPILQTFLWLLTGNLKTRISNGQQRMLVMVYSLIFFVDPSKRIYVYIESQNKLTYKYICIISVHNFSIG